MILDPGIGFGKTPEHNLSVLGALDRLVALGFPTLLGTSRKSTIGRLTARDVDGRAFGTAAMSRSPPPPESISCACMTCRTARRRARRRCDRPRLASAGLDGRHDDDADMIELRGIRAFGHHGADPGERDRCAAVRYRCRARDGSRCRAEERCACRHAGLLDVHATRRGSCANVRRPDRTLGRRSARRDPADSRVAARERAHRQAGTARRRDAGGKPHTRRASEGALRGSGWGPISAIRVATLERAKTAGRVGAVTARRRSIRTPPWGVLDQPPFVNARGRWKRRSTPTPCSPRSKHSSANWAGLQACVGGRERSIWTFSDYDDVERASPI